MLIQESIVTIWLKKEQLLRICNHNKAYKNKQQLLMNEITTILNCLHPLLDTTTYRQLQVISQTLLMMTGRITMLGISRWAEGKGGSYRTIQRFLQKTSPGVPLTGR